MNHGRSLSLSHLLLSELHLIQLLHVLLIVLLLQLSNEDELLLRTVRVLLRCILLELHRCLRIQCSHDLQPNNERFCLTPEKVRKNSLCAQSSITRVA